MEAFVAYYFPLEEILLKKIYVLDTNILLSYPTALQGFDDNEVAITTITLEELDNKKNIGGEVGYNAREAIRALDVLRSEGDLQEGVLMSNGGLLYISAEEKPISSSKADDHIIHICKELKENRPDKEVILVTNDIAMRVKASIQLGSESVQSYKNTAVKNTYTGHRDLDVSDEAIREIYRNKKINAKNGDWNFYENEFVTMHAGTSNALSVYRNGDLILIPEDIKLFDGVKPKNAMEHYAAWALTQPADEIPLVIMSGPAGTGKTFMSLAAGLGQTISDQKYWKNIYRKMLISRPNQESLDQSYGYLPGSLSEKMAPLLLPYHDNLETLLRNEEDDPTMVKTQIEDFFETGIIEVCALSYIRGRSLSDSFIIVDESQNAPRQLIKDIITRAGEGSKVILCGDPTQCDNPKLDEYSNGLVYAIDAWRDNELCATITYSDKHSIRSKLSKAALECMK